MDKLFRFCVMILLTLTYTYTLEQSLRHPRHTWAEELYDALVVVSTLSAFMYLLFTI